ncbi:S8 family serine peptidase [Actinoplanes sp. CA-252034]|uniref:S8 family serine peptidase n=1 Tax=Actinoplanes sp. CA-252034 TaxID=3239906 RepID=UPI003D99E439
MPATTRRPVALVLAAVVTTLAGAALPARAEPPADAARNRYYYTVGRGPQGTPENLREIAERFLGDPQRAGEILELNAGRVQPDGGRLTNLDDLSPGWHLVLPWDAVGAEVQHGPLPVSGARPSKCRWNTTVPGAASWGQSLLTPSEAWTVTDGSGVKVAIVGSGVDGSAPALAGRVLGGTDVATGTGRGDDSCSGSGTALAGIVAGDDGAEGRTFGVAPGAKVIPVKAGVTKPAPGLAATAIEVAASSGAGVLLVGTAVDAANPRVRAAISEVIARDVVVVIPATAAAPAADGLLRVGAADRNGRPSDGTAADLLAPGAEVASIGRAGTGPEYAAAFVAGTIALVRSADPGMSAAQVTRRVLDTVVDGVVDPVAAVTTPTAAEPVAAAAPAPAPRTGLGTLGTVLIGVAIGLTMLVTVLLVSYLRRRHSASLSPPGGAG